MKYINLTQDQITKFTKYVHTYKQYLTSPEGLEDRQDRQQRLTLYAEVLSPHGLKQMTELELGQVIERVVGQPDVGQQGLLGG